MTIPLYEFRLDEKREIVGNTDRAFDLKAGTGLRHIPDSAVDRGGYAENVGAAFEGSKALILSVI